MCWLYMHTPFPNIQLKHSSHPGFECETQILKVKNGSGNAEARWFSMESGVHWPVLCRGKAALHLILLFSNEIRGQSSTAPYAWKKG